MENFYLKRKRVLKGIFKLKIIKNRKKKYQFCI